MEVEYLTVVLDPADKKDNERIAQLRTKTPLGKFPVLELDDGKTFVSESLSIAKYWSNNKYGFYGPDESNKTQVDQWIDIISQTVAPLANQLV